MSQLPSTSLHGKSPHEMVFGPPLVLRHLRTWGCLAHAHVPPEARATKAKLDPLSGLSLFLGYKTEPTSYKPMDLRTGAVITLRSVETCKFMGDLQLRNLMYDVYV
ncbi:putative integrase catalytic domain-containing protein [Phytophthora infestans]|uniref:Putative integrase catalytic domain-containing protein n=1 Tax=Phytophthora infestans TaxID=4787 RepID=A0A833S9L3_PHYIN|nr:putative integrase catalytic domain-containing protein [Phytophthora infestans]